MAKGIFVIGTDTGIGKTVICAGLMYLFLSRGHRACYFKPVASGVVDVGGWRGSGDVRFVKNVSGLAEDERHINPFCFETPVSPHLAARMDGRAVDMDIIAEGLERLKSRYDYIITEGCGGLAVPLNDDGYLLSHLISALGFDCLLVAKSALGTINHTLITVEYARTAGIRIRGVIFSGFTATTLENDNIKTIKKLSGLPVLGVVPLLEGVDVDRLQTGNLREAFYGAVDIEGIIGVMGDI